MSALTARAFWPPRAASPSMANIGARAKRHAVRSDGYVFTVGTLNDVPTVWAGCRKFNEEQARAHWGDPEHPHGVETLAILDFLFR